MGIDGLRREASQEGAGNLSNRRRGDWLQTYTGKCFWPMDPREEDVDVVDIAQALGACARFAGHTKFPHSVAMHCVMVAEYCSPEHRLIALLHDASEAYLGDIVSPFKHDPCMAPYREVEARVQAVVFRALDIEVPIIDGVPVLPDDVHLADRRSLSTEVRDLMANPFAWSNLLPPYPESIRYYEQGRAAAMFLERWEKYRKGGP